MTDPFDVEALRATWTGESHPPFDLSRFRAELDRRNRQAALVVVAEALVTVALLALTFGILPWNLGDPLFLAWSWTFWAVAGGLAWWNRRGQWRRSVASPEEFVRLSLERARRKVRVVWIVAGLMVAQVAFVFAYWGLVAPVGEEGRLPPSSSLAFLAAVAAVMAVWGAVYHRRAREEERRYRGLLREMAGERGPGPEGTA